MTKQQFVCKIEGYKEHRVLYINEMILYTRIIKIDTHIDDFFIVNNNNGECIFLMEYGSVKFMALNY